MAKPIFRTEMCDILGLEYPIICTQMGGVSTPELIAAVGNAGGIGSLGVGRSGGEELRAIIRETKKLLDPGRLFAMGLPAPKWAWDKSYADKAPKVNLPKEHIEFTNKLKEEFNLPDPKNLPTREETTGSDITLMWGKGEELLQVCIDEKVPVVLSFLGNPVDLAPKAKAGGIKVVSMIGLPKHAVRCKNLGVDMVIATGRDAGGHSGEIGTFSLIPQVVDAVPGYPVAAGGGIFDGRGMAAAIALGAVGVNCGTVFCICTEAGAPTAQIPIHHTEKFEDWYKQYCIQRWIDSDLTDPAEIYCYAGGREHLRRTDFSEAWLRDEAPKSLLVGEQGLVIREFLRAAYEAHRADLISIGMGSGVGLLKKVRSAKQVVEDIIGGAIEVLQKNIPDTVKLS